MCLNNVPGLYQRDIGGKIRNRSDRISALKDFLVQEEKMLSLKISWVMF